MARHGFLKLRLKAWHIHPDVQVLQCKGVTFTRQEGETLEDMLGRIRRHFYPLRGTIWVYELAADRKAREGKVIPSVNTDHTKERMFDDRRNT